LQEHLTPAGSDQEEEIELEEHAQPRANPLWGEIQALQDAGVCKAFVDSQPTEFEACDFTVSRDDGATPKKKTKGREKGISDNNYAFILAYHVYKDTRKPEDPIPEKLKNVASAMKYAHKNF
jgi:hypothetical protein